MAKATKEPEMVPKALLDEALALLRESPTRQAIDRCCDRSPSHRYWPWKRKVETFLATLGGE